MQITSLDRLNMQAALADTRIYGRHVFVLVPSFVECGAPGCGFDETHDTGIDPSCEVCSGLGQIVVWAEHAIFANLRYVEQVMINFGSVPQGARLGDTFITFGLRDVELIRSVLNAKDAYILIDETTFRPTFIQVAGVGQAEEYVTVLAAFSPIYRAPGR